MLYDYKCMACEHVFERSLKMADMKVPESEPCPECGAMEVKKVILSGNEFCSRERLGRMKHSDGFNDVLKGVKEGNPGSTIELRK